jgi:hypothetical protein
MSLILEARNIGKSFPGVKALDEVSLGARDAGSMPSPARTGREAAQFVNPRGDR